jgi:hypothetical protein
MISRPSDIVEQNHYPLLWCHPTQQQEDRNYVSTHQAMLPQLQLDIPPEKTIKLLTKELVTSIHCLESYSNHRTVLQETSSVHSFQQPSPITSRIATVLHN